MHLNSLHFRKDNAYRQFWTLPFVPGLREPDAPVFVLISEVTFSGAEEFAYNLQALKRATIIGASSGGGANPGDHLHLTETLDIFVPRGKAVNPSTNSNWEVTGVHPDVVCEPKDALQVAVELCTP